MPTRSAPSWPRLGPRQVWRPRDLDLRYQGGGWERRGGEPRLRRHDRAGCFGQQHLRPPGSSYRAPSHPARRRCGPGRMVLFSGPRVLCRSASTSISACATRRHHPDRCGGLWLRPLQHVRRRSLGPDGRGRPTASAYVPSTRVARKPTPLRWGSQPMPRGRCPWISGIEPPSSSPSGARNRGDRAASAASDLDLGLLLSPSGHPRESDPPCHRPSIPPARPEPDRWRLGPAWRDGRCLPRPLGLRRRAGYVRDRDGGTADVGHEFPGLQGLRQLRGQHTLGRHHGGDGLHVAVDIEPRCRSRLPPESTSARGSCSSRRAARSRASRDRHRDAHRQRTLLGLDQRRRRNSGTLYSYLTGDAVYLIAQTSTYLVAPSTASGTWAANADYSLPMFLGTGQWAFAAGNGDASYAVTVNVSVDRITGYV